MGTSQEHVCQSCQRNDNQDIGPPSDDLLRKLHTLNASLIVSIATRQIEPNSYLGFGNNSVRNLTFLQDVPYRTKYYLGTPMLRGLDDRIRELCAKAVATQDSSELHDFLQQLRAAVHEHVKRLRKSALSRSFPPKRRAAG
jgi:hypothetical protein